MLYIVIFIISFFAISRSSAVLVRTITNLARLFQVSEYSLSFILAGIVASLPELFVGLSSAAAGVSALSFGNIVGANIINVSLIIGLSAFISGKLEIESVLSRKNFWLVFGIVLLPFLLFLDADLGRSDSLILLAAFFFYIFTAFKRKKYFTKETNDLKREPALFQKTRKDLADFFVSAIILVASSLFLTWSGNGLTKLLGIGAFAFGAIFISFVTTMPELVFSVKASYLKRGSMAAGAVMGTVAFNAGLILGLVSLLSPAAVQLNPSFVISAIFTFLPFLLFNIFVATKNTISRKEGLFLFLSYAIFLVIEYALL